MSSIRSSELYALTANNTASAKEYNDQQYPVLQSADTAESYQQFSEVAVLLIIVAAFLCAGIVGMRRIISAMPQLHASDAAGLRQIRRQLFGTVATVFFTFLLRVFFSIVYAIANTPSPSNTDSNCPTCSSCNPVPSLMRLWITLTPAFQLVVVLVSSPLAMLVALWGMTSSRTLRIMKTQRRRQQQQQLHALIPT